MPKTSKIVTATQLKNVGLKTIAVGGVSGLYFRNRPYQSYFFLRFQDKTGRHDLTLGTYPEMSLAKAREEASRLRARISAGENVIAELLHDSIKYPPIDNRNDPPRLSKEVLSHAKKKEDHGLRCVQQWRIKNHDQTRRKSEDPAPGTR